MAERFYITTAINYTNGLPHIGHAYEATITDIIARYHRVAGRDVYFVTGSDEHGQKVAAKAEEQGKQPIEIGDFYSDKFKGLNSRLNISNDHYIRTTSEKHKEFAQWIWKRVRDKGDIYLADYEGWYNVREEKFVTETEAKENDYKDKDSGQDLIKTKEPSYFFRMSKYHDAIKQHIIDHPEFIQPEERRNEMLSRLEKDQLQDLSISRTSFSWGVPVPDDDKHVMYVWFDALSNYLSAIDYNKDGSDLSNYWPANAHIIGKDIVWFHTIIWPCMLLAADIPLPKTVFAHGFVLSKDGTKMSKSLGNVVDPNDLLDKYDSDIFRYFCARSGARGKDVIFSEEAYVDMHDAELANTLGNFANRALTLAYKGFDGKVPDYEVTPLFDLEKLVEGIEDSMNSFDIQTMTEDVINTLKIANNWIAEKEPWKMKGEGANEKKGPIIRTCLEVLFIVTHLLYPIIPNACEKLFECFSSERRALRELTWNNLNGEDPIQKCGILFKRIKETKFQKERNQKK